MTLVFLALMTHQICQFDTHTIAQGGQVATSATAPARVDRSERQLRASYDAARSSRIMDNHWTNAEIQAANAAHNPSIQKILRARSRYEFSNNGMVQRMVLQKANDIVGSCPRLQMQTPGAQANRYLEQQFARWCKAAHFGARLRLQLVCRQVDGPGLAIKRFNPKLAHPVKLDYRVIDGDRLHTPDLFGTSRDQHDGIRKDAWGNIVAFDLLRDHPHADYAMNPWQYDTVSAEYVSYWIHPLFAEQERVVPETTAILNLAGQNRRYKGSVLTASELAASIAGIVRTNTGSVAEAADDDDVGDILEFEMGHLVTLPRGWGIEQMDARQPMAQYPEFNREQNKEQSAAMGMSLHKATGDYSETNYVSGQLADRDYLGNVDVERHDLGEEHLTPLFCDFVEELALQGLLPATPALTSEQQLPYLPALQGAAGYMRVLGRHDMATWLAGGNAVPTVADVTLAGQELTAAGYEEAARLIERLPHEWHFDQPRETDPTKAAIGRMTRLSTGISSLSREMKAVHGADFEQELETAAADLGLTVDEYRQRVADKLFGPASTDGVKPRTGATAGKRERAGVPQDTESGATNRIQGAVEDYLLREALA